MKTKCLNLLSLMVACVLPVFASAQTDEWESLAVVGEEDGTISTVVSGRYEFTSERYSVASPVNSIRFTFKENYASNGYAGNDQSGFPWVCISEFYIYDGAGNVVALAENNFTTNAQEAYEGPIKDICDGDKTTWWHSAWSSSAMDKSFHYLQVTLPEGIALSEFNFGWVTRYTTQGNPKTVEVSYLVPLTVEAQLAVLNKVRESASSYIAIIESLGLTKMKQSFEQAYAVTNTIDETSLDAIMAEKQRMYDLIATFEAGIAAYNGLDALIADCDKLVAERASASLSVAIQTAKSVQANKTASTAEEFANAYSALMTARNLYRIEGVETSSFNFSSSVTVGDWYLTLDKTYNVARVNQYQGYASDVVIPETFTYNDVEYVTVGIGDYYYNTWQYNNNNGYYHLKSVTLPATLRFIAADAFYNCKGLTEVQIPSFVEYIGNYAFRGCSSLQSMTLPNSVTYIGEYAFDGCSSMTEISLPNSLQDIRRYAFSGCQVLDNVVIPASVVNMGYDPFYDCNKLRTLRCEAPTPPSCDYFNENIRVVYVPAGNGAAYEAAAYWKNRIIVDGEGVSVNVNVTTPGTLGETLLAQVDYLRQVNYLTISGALNGDDINNIKDRMTGLLTIDMSEVSLEAIPEYMFEYRYALQQIVLPENLASIGQYAFRDCHNLQDVVFPATLKSIGNYAFYNCDNLKNVVIPEGVVSVGAYAFEYCDALKTVQWPSTAAIISNSIFCGSGVESIDIPEGVTTIGRDAFYETNLKALEFPTTLRAIESSAFSNCSSLAAIEFNEGLQLLGDNAFYNCDALTEVVLPSTLSFCSKPFYNCDNLKSVTCLALIPPYLEYDYDILYYVNKENCTLYVPEWTINKYKLTTGWDEFPTIEPIKDCWPECIRVHQDFTLELPDNLPAQYKPSLHIDWNEGDDRQTALTVNGNATLSVKEFTLGYDVEWESRSNGQYITHATLINNATMRADSVYLWVEIRNDEWSFLSFPFDVKVSDILPTQANTNFVVRKYSGKDRAEANFNNTWQNMGSDDILRAGEGYIWQSSRYDENGYWQNASAFFVSAVNNANKNLIFANSDRTIALNEYQSEFSHNRSWNLIGNPYPSYYDTRAMDFTAPITVWDMYYENYYAYSPVDDEYILRPGEAFFVQRPVDAESITFAADGRQPNRVVRERKAQPQTRGMETRQVFNLMLMDGEKSDRTRFVINPNATCDYDINRDANKFMNSNVQMSQFYTIESDVQFAINERPMGNGIITLGAYFSCKGTYAIELDTKVEDVDVILVDKLTGAETDLMNETYTFTADAGAVDNRFEIRMKTHHVIEEVEDAPAVAAVKVVNGQIVVTVPEVSTITVYNAEGQRIAAASATAATFDVESGIYIVKVQGTVHKVSVIR